ncbi:DinB family protein [Actinoplanes sp. HUAS TT8]|uniref:DinB family protein n=1 Tax=Actinoplanes sp. HUAS TT8 TaxID=3447453 RepID=UPI003F523A9A
MEWNTLLSDQLDFHWRTQLWPRLTGLSDDEYFWEPTPDAWTLRPSGDGFTIDWAFPAPEPPPVTTIAWRLGHIIVGVLGMRVASHFGGPPLDYQTFRWSGSASGALVQLDEAYGKWISGVDSLTDSDLARPVGPSEGPWAEHSLAELILHINREVIHHGAEISLLRDLYPGFRAGVDSRV